MVRSTRRVVASVTAAALLAGLFALAGPVSADAPVFRLQLLHASDLEGGVEAIERAPDFAAIVDALEDTPGIDASITLSAGDNYIPGPFFSAASDPSLAGVFNGVYNDLYDLEPSGAYDDLRANVGRVDVSIMNVIGFDASALGNHEFDLGSTEVANIAGVDARGPVGPPGDRWVGAQFPYLSANLDFAGDAALNPLFTPDLLPSSAYRNAPGGATGAKKIAPSTIVEDGGEQIGVVGATTQVLESISSPTGTTVKGPKTNEMPALAAILQPTIDTLLGAGVNKVVLVSHLQQFALEQELAGLLDGVDVIVAGGSDTILANDPSSLLPGATPAGPYPFVTTSSSGEPVAVVSTDGEYSYVGRLIVPFDADGVVVVDELDPLVNGPVAATPADVAALWGAADPFAPGTKGELVERLVDAVREVVIAKDSTIVGESEVFLEGRRALVRTQETNLGNLSADANLFAARQVDPEVRVSIKNGGGIRAEIGEVVNLGDESFFLPPRANPVSGKLEGQVSQLDVENSLRFNNGLSVLTTTAAGLERLMEHGVAATTPTGTPGQFPQVGGMRFSFDPTLPPGSRVRSLVVGDGVARDVLVLDGEVQGNPDRPVRLVTLGFLADGGDNYPFSSVAVPGSRFDLWTGSSTAFATPGREQKAFADYLTAFHGVGAGMPFATAETPSSEDLRIQDLAARDDAVDATVVRGTPRSDRLTGTAGDDILLGLGGNDLLVGVDGDDVLIGGPGNDLYLGGGGADRMVFAGGGNDTVLAFEPDRDVLDFQDAFADAAAFRQATRAGRGVAVVRLPDGGTVVVLVQGWKSADLLPGVNVVL
jgi:2',3'-cyclic-nucleotide 2'-phosphodiesterase (5'-nucleotidase family)